MEYARNVLGMTEADHEESSPGASLKIISKLTCSLVGQKGRVLFDMGTKARRVYGSDESLETFACNYGFNESFRQQMAAGALRVSGRDGEGTTRVVELPDHPFYLATLYLPQMGSTLQSPHPLILAFLRAAQDFKSLGARA